MTFFSEAKEDGFIDKKLEMSEQEFEMMLQGMLEDSNVWQLHKNKHKDANIIPVFNEEMSDFEEKVKKNNKSKDIEEPQLMQYDSHSKKFQASCNCGEKFEIDVKNDKVESLDPSLKMKEFNNYDRNSQENKDQQYGGSSNVKNPSYNNSPAKRPDMNYNSAAGTTYKN